MSATSVGSSAGVNRQFKLAARPSGLPKESDFSLVDAKMPVAMEGQVLVKTTYLSVDPYMRGRITGVKTYADPVLPGDVMVGGVTGEVIKSNFAGLQTGDAVVGYWGWQNYAVVPGAGVQKLNPQMGPVSTALGILGMPGMTAYFGFLEICLPKAGETVVVSGAAGAVGSAVGQIAKIKGCHVVGIAGGAEKCNYIVKELGFDAAIDYKDGATFKALRAAAPKGIDVYFDNVGGDILEACLALMNNRGRIACCGAISQYDGVPSAHGPRGVPGLIVVKRLIMQGVIVMDFMNERDEALGDLQSWVASGKL